MLVFDARQFAVGDPAKLLRLDQDRPVIARLGKFHLLASDGLETGGVGILVDLAAVGQDFRIDALGERAAFRDQALPRGVEFLVRQIRNAARPFKLENETGLCFRLKLRAIRHTFGKIAALARPHVAVVGLTHPFKGDAELVECVPVARRAVALAMHQPGEVHANAGHARIQRKSLGEDLPFPPNRLFDQRHVRNAHDGDFAGHRFLRLIFVIGDNDTEWAGTGKRRQRGLSCGLRRARHPRGG